MSTAKADPPRVADGERGAILIFASLIMFVLLAFAALAVDLGAAWAERRQDQTAADAGAMAGAIEYVRSNPTEAEVVALVKDYVQRNSGIPDNHAGWATCPPPTDGFQALAGNNCISLKQASTSSSDTLLKVRIPDQQLETTFARFVGINTLSVSAEAVARIEQSPGVKGALPFILPLNPGAEYCLGTPPSGQARELCLGPSSGNFGSIDSPFFGAAEDPWGTVSCGTSPTNNNTRVVWNTALGIDHFLRIAPAGEPAVNGADVCAATQAPAYVPHAIVADKGSLTQASDGFIGDGPYGSLGRPGRLRQPGGSPASWRPLPEGSGTIDIDNVGLWEYLDDTGLPSSDACHPAQFSGLQGTEMTAQLMVCLRGVDGSGQPLGTPKFTASLLSSPRFALVPQIDATQAQIGSLGPTSKLAINIVQFIPVYLQASWFNCSATECMYFDADDSPATRPEIFEPGEGSAEGCVVQGAGCKSNVNLVMDGISAIVLDNPDWLPEAFDNQFNDPGAFNVYLFR